MWAPTLVNMHDMKSMVSVCSCTRLALHSCRASSACTQAEAGQSQPWTGAACKLLLAWRLSIKGIEMELAGSRFRNICAHCLLHRKLDGVGFQSKLFKRHVVVHLYSH